MNASHLLPLHDLQPSIVSMLKRVLVVHLLLFCHLLQLLLPLLLLLTADSDVTERCIMMDKVVLI